MMYAPGFYWAVVSEPAFEHVPEVIKVTELGRILRTGREAELATKNVRIRSGRLDPPQPLTVEEAFDKLAAGVTGRWGDRVYASARDLDGLRKAIERLSE